MSGAAKKLLEPLIQKPLFVTTRAACPFSDYAQALVQKKGVQAEFLRIKKFDETHGALEELTGQVTLPYVFSRGKFIGGYTDLAKQPESFWAGLEKAR